MFSLRNIFVFGLLGVLWARPAMAYIDPINGAMLLQLMLSGIGGAMFFFRRVIRNFILRMKGRFSRKQEEPRE